MVDKEQDMKTLEQILEQEKARRHEDGDFGIRACKESIHNEIEWRERQSTHTLPKEKILFDLLFEYLTRARIDVFFNQAMVLACWEMINGKE